ncbi:MAG: LolA family protein, partial [Saprospiraceae bacterium]
MRHRLLNLLFACCSLSALSAQTGEQTLEKMHRAYAGNWCNTLTFVQRTENYQNDSLTKISTWYETIAYPGQFRIDFGDPAKGNATLFLGDSVFTFRKGALLRKEYRVNDLIFLLGGMHFHPIKKVKALFKEFGFDLSKGYESTWKGKAVYVIGATPGDETSNQLWIEK